jgi:hypothetical protein
MTRAHLLLLSAALLGPAYGCDSGDSGDDVPDVSGVRQFRVEGRLEDLFGGSLRWPNDLEIEWPEAIELAGIRYEVEDVNCDDFCWCSDDRCPYGHATATVDGVEVVGQVWLNDSSIDMLFETAGPLATLVDSGDCTDYTAYEPYLDFHFEEGGSSGTAFAYLDCQVWEGELITGLYNAAFRADLTEIQP